MSWPHTLFSSPQTADDFTIVYNNNLYRTLGLHRHSNGQRVNEFGKLKPLPAGWNVCDQDADALKIARSFLWQCEFVVFADDSAAWTSGELSPRLNSDCCTRLPHSLLQPLQQANPPAALSSAVFLAGILFWSAATT